MIETARLKLIPFSEEQIDAILAKDLPRLAMILGVDSLDEWTTFDGSPEIIPYFYEIFLTAFYILLATREDIFSLNH